MNRSLSLAVVLLATAVVQSAPPPEAQDVVLLADGRAYLVRLHIYVEGGRPFVGPYNLYLRKWFTYLDVNGDGTLSREEAARAPSTQQLLQGQSQFLGRGGLAVDRSLFGELDANGDGKVTPEEFIDYYRRSGFGPIALTNGNQFGTGSERASEIIFRALDTDRDGKLSRAELAKAEEVLRRFDTNDDEIITVDELIGNSGGFGRGVPIQGLLDQPTQSGPVLLLPADARGRLETAKRILAHYDKKKDGVLTRDSFRLPPALFKKLDTDKDGVLSAEELAAWLAMPIETTIALRLGKPEADKPAIEVVGDAAIKVERMPNDVFALTAGDLRVRLNRGSGGNQMVLAAPGRLRQIYVQALKTSDKGNKGFITLDDLKEDRQQQILRSVFHAADRNGDGKLTEKELIDYLDLFDGAPAALTGMTITEQGTGLFEMLDANGDGRLSIRELRNAGKRLAQLDVDGDGFIAHSELPRNLTISLSTGLGNIFDPRGGLVLTRPGVRGDPRTPAVPARGPLWFRKMDINGDGDVSLGEWLGTPEEFKLIDTDGDGLISVEEAEKYDLGRGRKVGEPERPAERRPPERGRERQ